MENREPGIAPGRLVLGNGSRQGGPCEVLSWSGLRNERCPREGVSPKNPVLERSWTPQRLRWVPKTAQTECNDLTGGQPGAVRGGVTN
jgi:hypothetical protein